MLMHFRVHSFARHGLDPSIVPNGPRSELLPRHQQLRAIGYRIRRADVGDADIETVISDLMSGQYSIPLGVVAFNTAEHWSEDGSEDVAREITRRLDLARHAWRHRLRHSSTDILVLTIK
jgi:hypothetical protein